MTSVEEAIECGVDELIRRDLFPTLTTMIYTLGGADEFANQLFSHMADTQYVVMSVVARILEAFSGATPVDLIHWPFQCIRLPKVQEDARLSTLIQRHLTEVFQGVQRDSPLLLVFPRSEEVVQNELVKRCYLDNVQHLECVMHEIETPEEKGDLLKFLFDCARVLKRWDKAEMYLSLAVDSQQRDSFHSKLSESLANCDPWESWRRAMEIQHHSLKLKTVAAIVPSVTKVLDNRGVFEVARMAPFSVDLQSNVLKWLLEECSDDAAIAFASRFVNSAGGCGVETFE